MSRKKALGRFVGVTPRFSPTEAGELLHIPLLEQVVGGGSRNLQSGSLKKCILPTSFRTMPLVPAPLWHQRTQERIPPRQRRVDVCSKSALTSKRLDPTFREMPVQIPAQPPARYAAETPDFTLTSGKFLPLPGVIWTSAHNAPAVDPPQAAQSRPPEGTFLLVILPRQKSLCCMVKPW